MMNEPVLIIAFNRPDHLASLIERLRQIGPLQVYVAIDGPRSDRPGERERVMACQALIDTIDWPCEIHRLFHERNHGCGLGVSSAVSWFFENVERGIILEDDIIPDPSFFGFCSELLDRYQHDERVFAITGCNFVPSSAQSNPRGAYRFSRVAHIWGWATWRRSWDSYRLDIRGWQRYLPMHRLWRNSGKSLSGTLFWAMTFELMARKQVDTWDAQLVYAAMSRGQLIATCNVNLVTNIGFGDSATHTREVVEIQPIGAVLLPTRPVPVEADDRADAWTRLHHFQVTLPGIAHQTFNYAARRFRRAA